ncbi:MAG: hypothetical protein RMY29_001490 [Nostoc sp. CreGUA01]|nr:hypothetical protein [Nostoc sp. CreGUA01]
MINQGFVFNRFTRDRTLQLKQSLRLRSLLYQLPYLSRRAIAFYSRIQMRFTSTETMRPVGKLEE